MCKVQSPIVEFEINPEMIGEGMTQSEMQAWDNCPEKWYLGYNMKLSRKGKFSWALVYGTWMHNALEEFYSTKGKRWSWNPQMDSKIVGFLSQEVLAQQEYWEGLGAIQMGVYASHYKGDFDFYKVTGTEDVVDYEFEGVRLKGKIDMDFYSIAHKGNYIMDHKTTGRLDKQTVMGWDFRLQFMFYNWLRWKTQNAKSPIHGCFINAIKKPALRQGKQESVPQILQRVQSHMLARPEEYFYRERLRLKKGDMQHFEDTILRPKLQRVKMLFDPNVDPSIKSYLVRNKNTDHCLHYGQPCEFLNVCKHGLKIEREAFYVREHKHEELQDESAS